MILKDKRILVIGGTGSLGQHLVKRLLSEDTAEITIFSRDEAKQYEMRLSHRKIEEATGEIIYQDHERYLKNEALNAQIMQEDNYRAQHLITEDFK